MRTSGSLSRSGAEEVRCTSCGVRLALIEDGALSIRRGDLQATIDGDFHAALVCYRPNCRTLNVLRIASHTRSGPGGLGG